MTYKEILNNYRDEIADMLRELVSFKSVNAEALPGKPFGDGVHESYMYMLKKAESDGFEIFDADGWGGHIEWQGFLVDENDEIIAAANETLGIPLHLDVVPEGDGWTHDAWAGEISDGRMYGRGTTDNKNAVCAVYYAAKALKDSGYIPSKNVRLILGLDEETGWSGMDRYFEKADAPDFGFAPDANFPVINGEKGFMVFEIAKKLEPSSETGLQLSKISGGSAPNMVPDHARAILVFADEQEAGKAAAKGRKSRAAYGVKNNAIRDKSYTWVKDAAYAYRERTGARLYCKGAGKALEISAEGISVHGAKPETGINAISILMDFLSELPIVNESAKDFIDFYKTKIGFETDGISLGIAMSDEQSGALVVNTGMIDMSGQAVILTINIRFPVSRKEDEVYSALMPVLDEHGFGVVKIQGIPPLYYDPDEPFIKTLIDVYRANTKDTESLPIVIGGGTFARAIPNAVAFGPAFPDEEELMHQKDEFIRLDNLMKSAQIYADAIYNLTKEGTFFV